MYQEKFEIELSAQLSMLAENLEENIAQRIKKENINIAENNDSQSVATLLCLALIDLANDASGEINKMMHKLEQMPESGMTPTYLKGISIDTQNPKDS